MSNQVSNAPAPTTGVTVGTRKRPSDVWSTAALCGVTVTVVVFAALHLLPPTSQISPVRRTLSEYALTDSAWAFDLGVVSLVLATPAVLAGFLRRGRLRLVSPGSLFGLLWMVGLLTLVGFPKHNWALGGPTGTGQLHRLASLVAFLALPLAAMAIARHRDHCRAVAARAAFWLGVLSLLWFSPLIVAVLTSPGAWWLAIPLGLIERGMALTEVAAIIALALLLRGRDGTLSRREPLRAR